MSSLAAGALEALGVPSGLVGDATPNPPSTPVQIGTSGPRHQFSEAGSWQVLLIMFALVLVLGAGVLMFAARQRASLLARRRVRRMGEVAAMVAAVGDVGGPADAAGAARAAKSAPSTPPGTTAAPPDRSGPNA